MGHHRFGLASRRHAFHTRRIAPTSGNYRRVAGARLPKLIVLRVLSPVTEPAFQLLRQVWAAWRQEMGDLPGTVPRLWNM